MDHMSGCIKNSKAISRRREHKMAALFKEKHGTIICRSLLPPEETSTNPSPSARTQQYYAKRPCGKYVKEAARIAGHMLKGELE